MGAIKSPSVGLCEFYAVWFSSSCTIKLFLGDQQFSFSMSIFCNEFGQYLLLLDLKTQDLNTVDGLHRRGDSASVMKRADNRPETLAVIQKRREERLSHFVSKHGWHQVRGLNASHLASSAFGFVCSAA